MDKAYELNFPYMEQAAKRPHIPLRKQYMWVLTWRLYDIIFHSSHTIICLMQDNIESFNISKQLYEFFTLWIKSMLHLSNIFRCQVFREWFMLSVHVQKTNSDVALLLQQAYVSSGHQMAPPSPNTNSSSNSSGGGGEQLSKTNLYIRGLHPGTTDQDLVKLCQPWVIL